MTHGAGDSMFGTLMVVWIVPVVLAPWIEQTQFAVVAQLVEAARIVHSVKSIQSAEFLQFVR